MKKWHIVLAIVAIIYILLMLYFVKSAEQEKYLFLSNGTLLKFVDDQWEKANQEEVETLQLYRRTEFLGQYTVKKEEGVYFLYDTSNHLFEDYSSPFIGFTKDLKVKVKNFEIEELNDEEIRELKDLLKENGILEYSILTASEKVSFDFDNDGQKEIVYAVSNAFLESEFDSVFSILYIKDNGRLKVLYKEIGNLDNLYSVGRVYLHSVIDYNGDGYPELIVGIEYFDGAGTRYQLYSFKKDIKIEFDIK